MKIKNLAIEPTEETLFVITLGDSLCKMLLVVMETLKSEKIKM